MNQNNYRIILSTLEETTPIPSNSQKSKRIAKNTMMLYFRMILTMLVSLYTSRVVLNTLGIEDYGIYNIVGGVIAMLGFFNSAMSSATQRFLSYEIGKGDFVQLRKTFNASQIIHIGIAILVFILAESIGLWFLKNYLVIPTVRMEAALWVYHFSVLYFMLNIIQVPYNATIIAHERMNVYAYVSILEVSLKLLIVFILTWVSFDKLKLYGVLQFCVVFIITAIYRIYTRRNFKESKFLIVKDKKLFKTLISYSGWSLFGNISAVAKEQGVSILLNMFFGPTLNAARGISNQVQSAVQSFAQNFQIAVNPQIIKSYANKNKEYMLSLIIRSSKFYFYMLYVLSLPIILEVNQILELWLINVPKYTSIFIILFLIVILIDYTSRSLVTAIQATGKIRVYQIIVGSLFIAILPLSYIFLKLGYSPEITLYINIVMSTSALFFRLYLVRELLDFPVSIFLKEIILKNILVVILSIALPLFIRISMDANISRLIIVVIVAVLWSMIIIYYVGLIKSEKEIVKKVIKIIHNNIISTIRKKHI